MLKFYNQVQGNRKISQRQYNYSQWVTQLSLFTTKSVEKSFLEIRKFFIAVINNTDWITHWITAKIMLPGEK